MVPDEGFEPPQPDPLPTEAQGVPVDHLGRAAQDGGGD